jgi:hypothetical protein
LKKGEVSSLQVGGLRKKSPFSPIFTYQAMCFCCYSRLVALQKDEYRMTSTLASAAALSKMTPTFAEPVGTKESAESRLGGITANLEVFHRSELCQILRNLGEEVPNPNAPEMELRHLIETAAWERYRREPESLERTGAFIDDLLAKISIESE